MGVTMSLETPMPRTSLRDPAFAPINRAFNATFVPDRLSLGIVVPIESYPVSPVPDMERHLERARLAETLGFSALWLRDVPFNVPSFGDAGQVFDPFVYLGYLAATTSRIGLGVASVVLPLRHPAHVAKSAASADVLSGGRILLGVASGDRPQEYPAMAKSFEDRGSRFREHFDYIRRMADDSPSFESSAGYPHGVDLLPKPVGPRLPVLITGSSRQAPDWVAQNGDGWMTYPRDLISQAQVVRDYRARTAAAGMDPKPVMQSLYVDLETARDARPKPIHLGFRSGTGPLLDYLKALRTLGVNHVALNLRFNATDVEDTMTRIAEEILPEVNKE